MKKLRIVILCMAFFAVSAAVFSGCSGIDDDLKGSTMIVATSPDFAPFEYKAEGSNALTGFDIDLIKEIGKRMDVSIQFKEMTFEGIISAIKTGAADAGISGFTINVERAQNVLFSDPYIYNQQVVVVRTNDARFSDIKDIDALEEAVDGLKIGACLGYVGASVAEWYTKEENITSYQGGIISAINALTSSDIDCFIMDYGVATTAAAARNDIKVLEISLVDEEYGVIVNLKRTTLVARINEQLRALKREKDANGKTFIDNLKEKYNIEQAD